MLSCLFIDGSLAKFLLDIVGIFAAFYLILNF